MTEAFVVDTDVYFMLLSIILFLTGTGCQNAKLTAVPATVALGDSITLTCNYVGTGNVSAVSWFNGSNSDVLILTPESIVPECNVFLTINTSYDPTRISYTCDKARNTYTLSIDPTGTVDDNVKWSCICQDPLPAAKQAEYRIHIKDIPDIPSNVTVTDIKETSITVQWISEYNGGLEQTFHIMITAGNITKSVYAIDPGKGKVGTHKIEDLISNTKYGIYMSANNSMGSSNVTNVIFQTTLKVPNIEIPVSMIVMGIISILVCILGFCLIRCIYRKKYRQDRHINLLDVVRSGMFTSDQDRTKITLVSSSRDEYPHIIKAMKL